MAQKLNLNKNDKPSTENNEPCSLAYKPKVGDFRSIRLHQFFLKDGMKVQPNKDGYYVAPSGEVLEMLEFYASLDLVEEVK